MLDAATGNSLWQQARGRGKQHPPMRRDAAWLMAQYVGESSSGRTGVGSGRCYRFERSSCGRLVHRLKRPLFPLCSRAGRLAERTQVIAGSPPRFCAGNQGPVPLCLTNSRGQCWALAEDVQYHICQPPECSNLPQTRGCWCYVPWAWARWW